MSVHFEVDSGASVSTITKRDALKCKLDIEPSNRRLVSYSKHVIHPEGQASTRILCGSLKLTHTFLVVNSEVNLLGRDLCQKLNISFTVNTGTSYTVRAESDCFLREFATYLSDDFQSSVRQKVSLAINDTANPIYRKARVVPVRLREAVAKELRRLEEAGRISKVFSSEWASPTVNVLKSDGTVRICGDFSATLNKVLQPVHSQLPSIDDVIASVGDARIFAKLDLTNAFLQLPLEEKSKPLTTINTSEGLYRYNYLPFGLSVSPGLFQGFINKLLDSIPNVIAYQDDILVLSSNRSNHVEALKLVLKTLRDAGIKINTKKSVFFSDSVTYLGHVFDSRGVHPNPEKIRAIIEAPAPSDLKQVQAFLGMCNFYARFIKNFSGVLQPLYELLKKGVKFSWLERQQNCFEKIKKLFTERDILKFYDSRHQTMLETDASNYGISAVLMQREGTTAPWMPVQFASRTLNSAEKNYSNVEREGLSVLFGVEKFRKFLLGSNFIICNDHLPLRKLFAHNSNIPTTCSARLQRWALRLSQYNYEFRYSKGTDNVNSDCLSRLPLPDVKPQCEPYEIIFNIDSLEKSIITCAEVEKYTDQDENLLQLKKFIKFGFPSKCANPVLNKFRSSVQQMSILRGCILFKDRVYIPEAIRPVVLAAFHENHPGITAMRTMARAIIWYPGLDKDICDLVKQCKVCQSNRSRPAQNNNVEWPTPARAWSRVHIDHFFFEGKTCLIAVDALSKYIEVEIVPGTGVAETIDAMRLIFSRNGLCDFIVSDNATCFLAEDFKKFLLANGIEHITPPPYSPASNGQAERGVRVVKDLLKKQSSADSLRTRLARVLFFYRTVPHSVTQVAPSVALNGRKFISVKDKVNPQYCPVSKSGQKSKLLKQFAPGDSVLALNLRAGPKWYAGTIMQRLGVNVYNVLIKDLNVIWKRHLNQLLISHSDVDCGVPVADTQNNSRDSGATETLPTEAADVPATLRRSSRVRNPKIIYSY